MPAGRTAKGIGMDALTILGHMPDYDKHSEHDKSESWEHYDV